ANQGLAAGQGAVPPAIVQLGVGQLCAQGCPDMIGLQPKPVVALEAKRRVGKELVDPARKEKVGGGGVFRNPEAAEFDRLIATQVADGAPDASGHVGVNVGGGLDRNDVSCPNGGFPSVEVGRIGPVDDGDFQVTHFLALEKHAADVGKATRFWAG